MDTLQIDLTKAKTLYQNADDNGKKLLNELCGPDAFFPKLIGEVTTFSQVCTIAGVNEADYTIPVDGTAEQKADACFRRLNLIRKVFNRGWKADLADTNQYKYWGWFNIIPDETRPSGFALSFCGCDYDNSCADLGVRLYYRYRETCEYVCKTFLSEYEAWGQYLNQCE